jgi:plasmid maintenance system antidote protein VapI
MKTPKAKQKKPSPEELAESVIYPHKLNKQQREQSLELVREYRKARENKRTAKERLISQLLQLRFQMEDYIKTDEFVKELHFGFFLKEYIARLDKKNKDFAQEINMDPSELSQVINKHRSPSDKLIIRLDIHSNKNFPALMWLRLIEKEKAYELIYDRKLRDQESKHVKKNLEFSL